MRASGTEALAARYSGAAGALTREPRNSLHELRRARGGPLGAGRDLSEATEPVGICAAVARALDVSLASAGDPAVERLGAAIAERSPVLVVLDNFEQIAEHASGTLGLWLRAAPVARFVVTSRERLRLPGERLFDLAPLSLPAEGEDPRGADAVRLFVERAQAVRRDFALTDEVARDVAAIVRELDGIPLAIELAAERVRVLGPAQLRAQLSRRFEILKGTTRGAVDRQATLRGAIDWSWNLLTPWEQAAWAQCSVFRGGFTPEAAEDVLDLTGHADSPPVLDALQAMVDRSLLTIRVPAEAPGTQRFVLLVSMREYAWERLVESGRAGATITRHAEHFLHYGQKWAQQVEGEHAVEALSRLGLETENLIAVHQRALARSPVTAGDVETAIEIALVLERPLSLRGPVAAEIALVDAALDAARASSVRVPPGPHALALRARADAKRMVGHLDECVLDLEEARALATREGNRALLAHIESSLGTLAWEQARFLDARRHYEESRTLARAVGARALEGRIVQALANTHVALGEPAEARHGYEEALAIAKEVGHERDEGIALGNLGGLLLRLGHLREVKSRCERALRIQRRLGDAHAEALSLANLGLVELEQGRLSKALHRFGESLRLTRAVGCHGLEGFVHYATGVCHLDEGRLEEARSSLEQALRIFRERGDHKHEGTVLAFLVRLEAASGDLDAARVALDVAGKLLGELGDLALVELGRGHLEAALAREALEQGDRKHADRLGRAARGRLRCARVSETRGEPARRVPVEQPLEVRLLVRSLETALETLPVSKGARSPASNALLVGPDATWFQPPGGERVSLRRRRPLRLLLERLADQRIDEPNAALGVDLLFQGGWPGERVRKDAAANRVFVALSTLRKLGLKDVLLRREEGYLLDPEVPLHRRADGNRR